MNEISYDQLLGIEFNHPISCPEINPLKFTGEMSSKIYEVNLNYDPEELKIDIKPLINVIKQLDNWSDGLVNKMNLLPANLRSQVRFNTDKFYSYLHNDYKAEIVESAMEINSIIDAWIEYRTDYDEYIDDIKHIEKEIESIEKQLLLKSFKTEEEFNDKKELLDYYKKDILDLKDKQEDIIDNFDRYIKNDFIKTTTDFSNTLEIVRDRNDNLRVLSSDLRTEIIKHGKDYFKLYQPTAYLEKLMPSSETEINIGILFNNTDTETRSPKSSYYNTIKRMAEKVNLSFEEKENLRDLFDNNGKKEIESIITDLLKTKGFKVIRYYIDNESYLKNKDNYISEDTKLQKFKKLKV